jgi:isopentenyl phosphate kinase
LDEKLTIIKLGGSVITNKNKPLSPNNDAIIRLAKVISKIQIPFIIIHGGGSFGHYWSVKYDMHTKPEKYSSKGISIVHSSMLDLNKIVNEAFSAENIFPYSISPFSLLLEGKPLVSEKKIIPITYGDVVHVKANTYSIVSGDVLVTLLSNILKPSKVIFTINVDGLFNNLHEKKIIREIDLSQFEKQEKSIITNTVCGVDDVTGGMKRKMQEALKIADKGTDVIFINGLKPGSLKNVLTQKKFKGTIFKGKK